MDFGVGFPDPEFEPFQQILIRAGYQSCNFFNRKKQIYFFLVPSDKKISFETFGVKLNQNKI